MLSIVIAGCGGDDERPAGADASPDVAAETVETSSDVADADAPAPPFPCDHLQELSAGVACPVAPSATGAGIRDDFGWHAVGMPYAVTSATPILVWFKGTSGRPFDPGSATFPGSSLVLLEEAVGRGYLTLLIAYDSNPSIGAICGADLACYGLIRREIVAGVEAGDPGNGKDVRPPNDIISRLDALITHLHAKAPGRMPSAIDWPNARVGGHSQGGGHAAYLARHLRRVKRLCMLAAPADGSSAGPAEWIAAESTLTPVEAVRGLIHAKDTWFLATIRAWTALGMKQDVHWRVRTDPTTDPHNDVAVDLAPSADRTWACLE